VETVTGRRPIDIPAHRREAIVKEWLARTLRSYPEQTSRFLFQQKDPFRNPVGHHFGFGFAALVDELLGEMDAARLTPAMDAVIRIRAVQDFSASEAVAFVFVLKDVFRDELREDSGALADLDGRIDELALLAFDLFMKCREKLYEIKAGEERRKVHVLRCRGTEAAS